MIRLTTLGLIACLGFSTIHTKVLIFHYAFNRPDFIKLQYLTLKTFLEEDFDMMVFNDAKDAKNSLELEKACNELNIACIRVPQEIHSKKPRVRGQDNSLSSTRHCNVINYSLVNYGYKHDDILMIIDSDMFPVKKFSVRKYMSDCQLVGAFRAMNKGHLRYVWPGLTFMDLSSLPEVESLTFDSGFIGDHKADTGGSSYNYLKSHPNISVQEISCMHVTNCFMCDSCSNSGKTTCAHRDSLKYLYALDHHEWQLIDSFSHNFEFYLERTFLHYKAGTNWNGRSDSYHQQKFAAALTFINARIKSVSK